MRDVPDSSKPSRASLLIGHPVGPSGIASDDDCVLWQRVNQVVNLAPLHPRQVPIADDRHTLTHDAPHLSRWKGSFLEPPAFSDLVFSRNFAEYLLYLCIFDTHPVLIMGARASAPCWSIQIVG